MSNIFQAVEYLEMYIDATSDLFDPDNPALVEVAEKLDKAIIILKREPAYRAFLN